MRKMLSATIKILLLCMIAGVIQQNDVTAQSSAEIGKTIGQIRSKLSGVSTAMRGKKNDVADKELTEIENLLEGLKKAQLSPVQIRVLTDLARTAENYRKTVGASAPPATPTPNTPTPGPATNTPPGKVSFLKEVAPMLAGKCGRCHMGNQPKGNFSMATFTNLMRGAEGRQMITAKDGKGSRIVEVIADGDMPRGGGKVAAGDLAKLTKWIDEGAIFDGSNANAPLNQASTGGSNLAVTQATGNETVSYSRDVAPVLAANCMGCHGGDRPRADLGLNTFARLLKGGDSGAIVSPGKPGSSLLIGKLKGTADGARMPMGRSPLPNDVIAKIEKWIQEGAKFDGPDPNMNTLMVANVYKAKTMTHEELGQERLKYADKNWRLANPEEKVFTVESEHFVVMGNVIKSRLEEISKIAEEQHAKIASTLKVPSDQPLFKGRLTIFVFDRRYQYSEYGTMVEKRRIPRAWRAHWAYNVIDAYACLAPPDEEQDTLERLLAEIVAGSHLETLGAVPAWFTQGVGRALSAQGEKKNPTIQGWDSQLGDIIGSKDVSGLVDGTLGLEEGSVIAYGFGKVLFGKKSQFNALVDSLQKGESFDAAFSKAYKTDPKAAISSWARSPRKR